MTTVDFEYYSQNGEDYLLHWLFEDLESGFYVDIGAFDGRHISNTYVFEQLGWSGICVEPHPDYFPTLQRNRPHAICVQAAIVDTPEPSVAFKKERLGLLSGVAADSTRGLESRYASRNMTFEGYETIEVPALTPDALMEKHAAGRRRFEILSIDTAGTDLAVLRALDPNRFWPAAIVIEADDDASQEAITSLLSARRYHLARRLGPNLIFCRMIDRAAFVRHKRVTCRMADAPHPLGQAATQRMFRAQVLEESTTERQLAPNVLQQMPGQPLSTLFDWFPDRDGIRAPTPGRIVHAVNLFSGRTAEQTLTTRSLAAAARHYEGEVSLLNVQHPADPDLTPEGFVRARDLTRDMTDIGEHGHHRALPLLFDILDRAVDGLEPDDHVIYTNADICTHEYFYECIQELLAFGFDAITINRRTIGRISGFPAGSKLPLAETGLVHPGFDCFVFRRGMYDRFVKNLVCLGGPWVERGLLYNMVAHSEQMLMLKNVSLTYHFGNDVPWDRDDASDYSRHNYAEMHAALVSLSQDPQAHERLTAFCQNHREPAAPPRYPRKAGSEAP